MSNSNSSGKICLRFRSNGVVESSCYCSKPAEIYVFWLDHGWVFKYSKDNFLSSHLTNILSCCYRLAFPQFGQSSVKILRVFNMACLTAREDRLR